MDMKVSTVTKRLKRLRELNRENVNFLNLDLYKLLIKEDTLLAGYEKIQSNKGSTTPAASDISLDGFSLIRLTKLKIALSNESWQPSLARRIYIPKPGKVDKRPLTIQGPEEKIVQAAMLLVLEAIYEPCFSPHSYGFRPGRGAHNALLSIEQNYDGMTFAIEGDIKGMYDNVNHHILVTLVQKKVKDDRFIRLLWKMLRAGYLSEGTLVRSELGTPQGSIVSPILANIYLHELDLFVESIKTNAIHRNNNLRTPLFKVIDNRMRKAKYRLGRPILPAEERAVYIEQLKSDKLESFKVRTYLDPSDRLFYTRYADDFIIGIAGSLEYANKVKEQVRAFLTLLKLTLSEEKTKVTDIRKDNAIFLGHLVGIDTSVKIAKVHVKGRTPHLQRVTGSLVTVRAPIPRIVDRLYTKGFCDKNGFPCTKKLWIGMDDDQIVRSFSYTIRGLLGFYSGASRRRFLQRIWYILKFSCAYTLSAKHRRSLSKTFKKHGKLLTITYGDVGQFQIALEQPNFKEETRKWQLGKPLPDPYRIIAARLSKTKIYEDCCICGAPSSEMHHVRHLKDSKQGFSLRIMGLVNRKQIPVCLECHDSIHAGRYDGISLGDLAHPKVASR